MEKVSITDILMKIHDRSIVFFKADTMEIVSLKHYLDKYVPKNPTEEDLEKVPSLESLNIHALPNYDFLNHKYIMSEYVRTIYDNKETRKKLFYILRNHDYMDKFYDCLQKHDLYDDYRNYCYDYYIAAFEEWCIERNIKYKTN